MAVVDGLGAWLRCSTSPSVGTSLSSPRTARLPLRYGQCRRLSDQRLHAPSDEAWEYVKYLTTRPESIEKFLAYTGRFPALTGVHEAYPRINPAAPKNWPAFVEAAAQPGAYFHPSVPEVDRINDIVNTMLSQIWRGETDPRTGMQQFTNRCRQFWTSSTGEECGYGKKSGQSGRGGGSSGCLRFVVLATSFGSEEALAGAGMTNLAHGMPYWLSLPPGRYPDQGNELTDGVKGGTDFGQPAWQGHLREQFRVVTIDLPVKPVRKWWSDFCMIRRRGSSCPTELLQTSVDGHTWTAPRALAKHEFGT